MKTLLKIVMLIGCTTLYCCGEDTRNEIKKAKEGISTANKMIKESKGIESKYEKLKSLKPLTNDDLKQWLPNTIENYERTGFKVGQAGFVNVASVEGTYKNANDDSEFKVQIIDGAGPIGSGVILSVGFANSVEMEEENEQKHIKTVKKFNTNARQTYHKIREKTDLQFLFAERFSVTIGAKNLEPEATWQLVDKLNLEKLNQQ